jgi:hypothetical protein
LIGGHVLQNYGGSTLWGSCLFLGIGSALVHLRLGPARRRRLELALDGPAAVRRENGFP